MDLNINQKTAMNITSLRLLLVAVTLILTQSCLFSQKTNNPVILVAYDTNYSEPDGYKILVLYKDELNKLYRLFETTNLLEYFKYHGKVCTEDGNIYHLFKDYSLPAGLSTLFYVSNLNLDVYQFSKIQEYHYPLYFSFNSTEGELDVLSIDVNDCGQVYEKPISKKISLEWKGQQEFDVLPLNYEVLFEISF